MKKVYFRKTTEYYLGKDKSKTQKFLFLKGLGLQKINPKPSHKFKNLKKDVLIICSPLKRVLLSMSKNTNYLIEDSLKEVLFDIFEFSSIEEFSKEGSILIRKKFKEFFIADKLPEKRKKLFKDIRKLLIRIKKLKVKEVMILSHSFKLKLIEAYIKTNGEIENNPQLINKFIKNNDKTYNFEEGFDTIL